MVVLSIRELRSSRHISTLPPVLPPSIGNMPQISRPLGLMRPAYLSPHLALSDGWIAQKKLLPRWCQSTVLSKGEDENSRPVISQTVGTFNICRLKEIHLLERNVGCDLSSALSSNFGAVTYKERSLVLS